MRILPARRLRGALRLPGDKSISHRACLLTAMAEGRSRIRNFSTSADCASSLRCLEELGVRVSREDGDVLIEGAQRLGRDSRFSPPARPLDCGNSGSTMRMLAGVLAGEPFISLLTGDDSLRSRPMRRIIEPLTLMGARFESDEGRAPLRLEGRRPLRPLRYEMPVASAQVKSAVLLAGLSAEGRTEVVERKGTTRDHTERMLRWFGVNVETRREETPPVVAEDAGEAVGGREGGGALTVSLNGPADFPARDVSVPGDISSAAFFIAAASLLPGSDLRLEGVGLNPTRTRLLDTMSELGARLSIEERREECFEEVGNLRVGGADVLAPAPGTGANVLSGTKVVELIDELPVLAVVGSQVEGGLEIRGAGELRVKESDRIGATVENLRAMGAGVEEYEDGLSVGGPVRLRGARLDAHGDHRIAMAFAVAALVAEGESEIAGAESAAVSFPEFFRLLEEVTER